MFRSLDEDDKENKKIALEAVKADGLMLEYMGDLKHDQDIMVTAVTQNHQAIKFLRDKDKSKVISIEE